MWPHVSGQPFEVTAKALLEYRAGLRSSGAQAALMAKADPNAIFMHCLPAYHDKKTAIGNEMCTRFGLSLIHI